MMYWDTKENYGQGSFSMIYGAHVFSDFQKKKWKKIEKVVDMHGLLWYPN